LGVARDETVVYRTEVLAIIGALSDLLVDIRAIRKWLEGDDKRKRMKRDREPSGRDLPSIPESARRLRELHARGLAELEERRKLDPNAR
jgi:hypothetical protein